MAHMPLRPHPGLIPQQRPHPGGLIMSLPPSHATAPVTPTGMPALPLSMVTGHQHNLRMVVSNGHYPASSHHPHTAVTGDTHHQHISVMPTSNFDKSNLHHPRPSAAGILAAETVANTKEKTHMCLINELARYNKIQHQYCLIEESGPPHKKIFRVTLQLGEEEYSAQGPSIKKAQHATAAIALEKTAFKHPPAKTVKKNPTSNVTPTVELNALAMKRGEPTYYSILEPRQLPIFLQTDVNFKSVYNHYSAGYVVSLKVGAREYFGTGITAQAAKHNAAAKALAELKSLQLPDELGHEKGDGDGFRNYANYDINSDVKSPISLVYELALKHNLKVNFDVVDESGPAHMKVFVTRCLVGDLITEGEGSGKKVSKRRAAEKMLEQLMKLSPAPTFIRQKIKKKATSGKKKSKNLIKASPEMGYYINPVSHLVQIQQSKKGMEPVYTLVGERGVPNRREFTMQVSVGNVDCVGNGLSKRLAKRAAAENLLKKLGYSRCASGPEKPSLKSPSHLGDGDKSRKVTFVENSGDKQQPESLTSGRQLVPGLLLMPDGTTYVQEPESNLKTTAAIAKELLKGGTSPTAEALNKGNNTPRSDKNNVAGPKDQLMYLATVLNFKVQFTDFPKGKKSEYLSLVSLSTQPPQVCHGSGPTIEASHEQAALSVLKALSELGLDSITTSSSDPVGLSGGDRPRLGTYGEGTVAALKSAVPTC